MVNVLLGEWQGTKHLFALLSSCHRRKVNCLILCCSNVNSGTSEMLIFENATATTLQLPVHQTRKSNQMILIYLQPFTMANITSQPTCISLFSD